ncbi:MAG: hypothetical protein KDC98_09555 [Planctomycetes bacterium]|nr:hypothetical protein [Planctomycetota bacterium]
MSGRIRALSLSLAVLAGAIGLIVGFGLLSGAGSQVAPPPESAAPQGGEPPAGGGVEYRHGLPQGHFYAGVTSEPDDVNPFTSHGTVARRFVLGLTHEGLVDTDPVTGELRGALAASWQLAADAMSCTFVLRDGVRFSDGTPVTMADVLFGWELARAGHVPLGFIGDAFGRVAAAEALDDRHLRVTFRELHYAAVRAVGERWLVAQREFFVRRVAAISRRLGEPLPAVESAEFATRLGQIDRDCGPGTGPFQLPSDDDGPLTWTRRQELTLTRNPYHWRREAMPGTWNLAGMRLLFREGTAVFTSLLEGEIDWLGGWSVDAVYRQRPELAADYRPLIYDYETLGVIGIRWNCRKPAFADVRVRRALGMLIDRDAIVSRFADAVEPAMAFAKPGSPGYPVHTQPLSLDVVEARRLLAAAGLDPDHGKPLRVEVLTVRDGGPMDYATSLLVDAAKGIGVQVDVERVDFKAYVAGKLRLDWDGLVENLSFRPWGDPYAYVHSKGMDNDGSWSDPEADRLAAAARCELEPDRRAELWRQLHELVYREQPFTFLVHPRSSILFNRHIENAEPGPRGLWPERWWVAPEHQRR